MWTAFQRVPPDALQAIRVSADGDEPMSMGDVYHYHGSGDARYGHRHPFLHIVHDHDESSESANRVAVALLGAIGMAAPVEEDATP